jgi:radical SAM superfamily enzyme YgiQ (UPF0313 family)
MTCEPLELEYVSSVIEAKGHRVVFVDMMLERKPLTFFVKKYRPNVVCFTAYITHVNVIKTYSDEVKKHSDKIITVVGGVYSEVVPNDFVYPSIDYVVGLNGLKNLEILLDNLEKGRRDFKFSHKQIDRSHLAVLPDRTLTAAYRSKYDYAYYAPCALVKTSFGCPYNCKFCFCIEITQHSYYELDLETVIRDLKSIKEPNIFIVDDNFLVNRDRIIKFCQLLDINQITKKFIIFGRADFIVKNEDMVKLLGEHNVEAIFVGIESFRQQDLVKYNKKTNVKVSEKAAEILYKYRIDLYAGIVIEPDFDKTDFKNLVRWLKKSHVRFANLQPLVPMPGTQFYAEYKDKLLLSRNEQEKWDMTHIAIKTTKIRPSVFYWELIKAYFNTTASLDSIWYIFKKSGLKITLKCISGSLIMVFYYIKMMYEYRNIKVND